MSNKRPEPLFLSGLPQGWSVTFLHALFEIRDAEGSVVHTEPVPTDSLPEGELYARALGAALLCKNLIAMKRK